MKTYSIWAEGYRATCEHGTATLMGHAEGETFIEACEALKAASPSKAMYYNLSDPSRPTYWGCKLFDNEADARRAFG